MKTLLLLILFAVFGTASAQSPSFLWAKAAGGTNYDEGSSVCTDTNGNVYVTGYFQSPTITFGTTTLTNSGAFDIFIVKYDASGNVLWAKSAGGAKDDVGNSICTDANGNVLITGLFYSTSITFETTTLTNAGINADDIFVVKYDTNGNLLWAKSEGGAGYEYGKSISTDTNGNVFVTGNFSSSSISFGAHTLTNTSAFGWDIFVVKYNAGGNVLWAKAIGGTAGEFSGGISNDTNGDVCVTGYFYSPSLSVETTTLTNSLANFSDIFVAKYDANGNLLWAKSQGGTDEDAVGSTVADMNGNVFVTGYFKSPAITFGTSTLTNVSNGSYDFFVVKYNASGNVVWAKSAGGTNSEFAYGISADVNGNVAVTGSFYSSTLTLGATTFTNANTGQGQCDIFLAKYDANGSVLWAKAMGGTDADAGLSTSADTAGNVFVTGYFHSSAITFGPTTLTNTGGSVFVGKLGIDVASTGITNLSGNSTINIFPNPFSSSITLQANENLKDATLQVYNSIGQVVKEIKNISGHRVVISLNDLANGSYFVRLTAENGIYADKLIIKKRD